MRQVYKYDEVGIFLEPVLLGDNDPFPENCTEKPLPQPNWKPIFDKAKKEWVEKITEKEKEALQNVEQPKTEIELVEEINKIKLQLENAQEAIDFLLMGGL